MKIEKVTIRNFKGIESLEQEINGRNVFVMGPNGAGKTSFLDAIWTTLTGKDIPAKPVKKGSKRGLVEIDLGDHIARLKFTDGKDPMFELEAKEGEEKNRLVKTPRTVLNDSLKIINFDVNEFITKTGAKQVEYLCKVVGIDFTEVNGLLEEALEGRKIDKKKLEALKASGDFYDKKLAAEQLIDVVQLSQQIADAGTKWRTYERGKTALVESQQKQRTLSEQIAELQKQLLAENEREISIGNWLNDKDNAPVEDSVYNEWKVQLQTANATNATITQAKNLQKIEAEIEQLEGQCEAGETAVEDLRRQKATMLKEKLNVENLEYDVKGEQFTWKGLSFDKNQINTADLIIAGLKIGATLLGDLRIMKFDGSLIDKKNFVLIKEFAASQGIELFVEIVDRENETLQVIVE